MAVSQLVRVLTTVGRGEVAQHVIKATFSDDDKPKEKHVKALVDVLQSMPPSHPEYDFVPQLIERAHSGDWKVAFKALTVIHRLTREGTDDFLRSLGRRINELSVNLVDMSSTEAWGQSAVVRSYSNYLVDKLATFNEVKQLVERSSSREGQKWVSDMPLADALRLLPLVHAQFHTLVNVKPYHEFALHPIAHSAFLLMMRDAFLFEPVLTTIFLRVFEHSRELSAKQAETALGVYKRFLEDMQQFRVWASALCELKVLDRELVPTEHDMPKGQAEMIAALKVQIDAAKGGGGGGGGGGGSGAAPHRRGSSSAQAAAAARAEEKLAPSPSPREERRRKPQPVREEQGEGEGQGSARGEEQEDDGNAAEQQDAEADDQPQQRRPKRPQRKPQRTKSTSKPPAQQEAAPKAQASDVLDLFGSDHAAAAPAPAQPQAQPQPGAKAPQKSGSIDAITALFDAPRAPPAPAAPAGGAVWMAGAAPMGYGMGYGAGYAAYGMPMGAPQPQPQPQPPPQPHAAFPDIGAPPHAHAHAQRQPPRDLLGTSAFASGPQANGGGGAARNPFDELDSFFH